MVASSAEATLSHACSNCGAALPVDQSTPRIVECSSCRAELFLPDDVWHRIHPVARVHSWFVDTGVDQPKRYRRDREEFLEKKQKAIRRAQAEAEERAKKARQKRVLSIVFVAVLAFVALVLALAMLV